MNIDSRHSNQTKSFNTDKNTQHIIQHFLKTSADFLQLDQSHVLDSQIKSAKKKPFNH